MNTKEKMIKSYRIEFYEEYLGEMITVEDGCTMS